MKKVNLSELRSNLREYVACVKNGESVEIQDRNIPVAHIIPLNISKKNKTKLGAGKGTVKFYGDILSSIMEDSWENL
jgi:prevent-host-death family protein